MTTAFRQQLAASLAPRKQSDLWRERRLMHSPQGPEVCLDGRSLLSFCSNDYLGLANDPRVVEALGQGAARYGVGSGASHLVSGHGEAHHALEDALAEFTGRDRALLFSSGYMANLGVIASLAGKGDRVLQDRLNHASLLDGGLLSGARFQRYPHADPDGLARLLLKDTGEGRTLVVTDGVFSMDGDIAPLPALARLATDHGAVLAVDDAHGFGCLGRDGAGSLSYFQEQGEALDQDAVPVLIGTLGKSFGSAGAFVAGSEELVETLIQSCRPYIYTTALPPAVAFATLKSLEILREEQWRRQHLATLIAHFRHECEGMGLRLLPSSTPIQALVLGEAQAALAASRYLESQGIHVSAIRPPTVPKGTARLRITFSASHTQAHVERLLETLRALPEGNRQ